MATATRRGAATWVPSSAGERALMMELSAGANAFAEHVRTRVQEIERGLERYHFSSPTVSTATRYPNTINQATYFNGDLVGGVAVRGVGNVARSSVTTPIRSVVYTTSFLGHLLEVTGAAPHDIEIPVRGLPTAGSLVVTVSHPGFNRRPHFVPGLLSAVHEVGGFMRGKLHVGPLRPPPAAPPPASPVIG